MKDQVVSLAARPGYLFRKVKTDSISGLIVEGREEAHDEFIGAA